MECVNLHIRGKRKGGGVWGLERDFDDGMMLEVTTNMETRETPLPSRFNQCWSRSAQQTQVFFAITLKNPSSLSCSSVSFAGMC